MKPELERVIDELENEVLEELNNNSEYEKLKRLLEMKLIKYLNHYIKKGFRMNHSTARNVFVNSLKKIAKNVVELYDVEYNEKELTRIAKDPRFQDAVVEFMRKG